MSVIFRSIQVEDKAQWLALWQGYTAFYESQIPDNVTEYTWKREMASRGGFAFL